MQTSNPLLSDWEDMFQIPPFDLIKDHHFDEAFETFEEFGEFSACRSSERPGPDTSRFCLYLVQ